MRYIDVDTNGLTQNLLAVDLRFKQVSDTLINLTGTNTNNLAGANNLAEAMEILDNFVGGEGTGGGLVDGTITVIDEDGNETGGITKIVFDEVIVTGVNEVTVGLDGNLDRVVQNINDNTVIYEGIQALTHIFTHNMQTEFFKYSVWVEEEAGWQNSIVPITIVDINTVKVELSQAKSVRIILENLNDVSKTYGL